MFAATKREKIMFTHIMKTLLCVVAVAVGLMGGISAQAQRVRYNGPTFQNSYYGRGYYPNQQRNYQPYTTRKPVYDGASANGTTNSIVTQTPQGPVRSTSTINPYTGEQISTTYWRDPRTGQVTTSERVVNARTGQDQASTRTVNPYTGSVQRSNVQEDRRQGTYSERISGVDPWSGTPYRSRATVNPFGETYEHQDPNWGGSRVTVPYRPYQR